MKQNDNSELRKSTVRYWAAFTHPGTELDIARVYAFRELDPETATDDEVSAAYGGRGWAPTPVCIECGARDDGNVLLGPKHEISLCVLCITRADSMSPAPEPAPKKSFFSRLIGN